jgi:putative sigma-54 modulation protein
MRLNVNGKNVTVTKAIKEYVEEKIGRIVNHYDQILDIEVTLEVIKNPSVAENHIAEVSCKIPGERLHVTEKAESMYASIDLVADKLNRQVIKHKEKLLKGKNKGSSIRILAAELEKEFLEETEDSEEVIEE